MSMQAPECWWLDERQPVALPELVRMCGISAEELSELVEYGALALAPGPDGACFTADYVHPLREAARLRGVFDLDLFTVGLLTGYLHRIEALERQVRALRAHAPLNAPHLRDGPQPWREPHA